MSQPVPRFDDRARQAIFSWLGPALGTVRAVPAAGRWALVETLLAFFPPVPPEDARTPLLTMRVHLDALDRALRDAPLSPAFPEAPQAAARAYLQRLHGPTLLDRPLPPLLDQWRTTPADEEDLTVLPLALTEARRTPQYRPLVLGVALYSLHQAVHAADQYEQARGVRLPWEATLGDFSNLRIRPARTPEIEALMLLEVTLRTADAARRQTAGLDDWRLLARVALRAGQASSPLPWVDGWAVPDA